MSKDYASSVIELCKKENYSEKQIIDFLARMYNLAMENIHILIKKEIK